MNEELEKLVEEQQHLEKNRQQLQEKVERLEEQIQLHEMHAEEKAIMEIVENEIIEVQQKIDYRTMHEQQFQLEQELVLLQEEKSSNDERLQQFEQFLEESMFILKLDDFQKCLLKFRIDVPSVTHTKITELQHLILKIKESLSRNTYDVWNSLEQRLDKAIPMLENILREQGFLTQAGQRTFQGQNRSPEEVHAFLDRMGRFLVAPQMKQLLVTRNYSAEKYDALEKLASAYTFLKQQKQHARMQYAYIEQQKTMIEQSKQLFKMIKKETIEAVNRSTNEVMKRLEMIAEKSTELLAKQAELKEQYEALPKQNLITKHSIAELIESLEQLKERSSAYKQKRQAYHAYQSEFENNQKTVIELTEAIVKNTDMQEEKQQGIEQIKEKLIQNESSRTALQDVLQSEPEKEQELILKNLEDCKEKIEAIKVEQEQLPMKEALQQQWLSMLENATDYDLDEIKKLYIQHANVIGTTCVASARRDFMEDYPTFDVVIIDEVSKATPPELLLPMLKGKKIILVGDHHQLPPLMGQETLEEFLEESTDAKEKKELEQLLKESLFERLFRTLPKQNKTMLGIQYRMHEKIMDTITPFYKEGDYALQCGLENSDVDRDHLLESRHYNRNKHLLWFDVPNEKPFFEDRVKGGTSRFNEAELSMIRTLLTDLNEATNEAIQAGRIKSGAKKNVGVISFYGEQVKRIDLLIHHELNLPHLHCRTGSVDKFQGMEMDVIILSFVRNHDHPGGDIGFAKDYRRLNVALSRARELLMIVGSADMFTKRPKNLHTRKMFERLLNHVQEQEGYKQLQTEVN